MTSKRKTMKQAVDLTRSFAHVHAAEFFIKNFGRCCFDVTQAWRIVDAWTPEMRRSRFTMRKVSAHQLDVIGVDVSKVMHADLSIPVLWVTMTELSERTGKPYRWMEMIDGYHRAHKAFALSLGLALPSFVLSEPESAACRIADILTVKE